MSANSMVLYVNRISLHLANLPHKSFSTAEKSTVESLWFNILSVDKPLQETLEVEIREKSRRKG